MVGASFERAVSDQGRDDTVTPFAVEPLDVRGRLVRLGPAIDAILHRHAYPEPVARLLAQAVALTTLLGTALKFEGRFQLQTRTDGPVDLLVVDFDAPDRVRAFARFDAARVESGADEAALLGHGHFALTVDPGGQMSRYQGVVALQGQGLEEAAHQYFRQSEQIPTLIRLAVGEVVAGGRSQWRAGALLVQFLPVSPERQRQSDFHPGDAPEGAAQHDLPDDEAWAEAKALAGTVEDHELVDPTLSGERLLYRLFHERGVKVFEPLAIVEQCRCSAERVESMLRSFSREERRDMVGENGRIAVTCEFCSTERSFDPADFDPAE